ncbi:MAG: adenylate/guanylate cyclase domain-containing protein [Bacteroidota bacterium]
MLKYIKLYAYKENDSPDLAFQKQLLIITSSLLFVCGVVWTIMFYSIFGWTIPAIAAFLYAINAIISIAVSHYLKNHSILVYSVFYASTAAPVLAQWAVGSMENSGMVIVWGFLTPLGILIFTKLRPAIFSMGIFVLCILITAIFQPTFPGPTLQASPAMIKFMYSMNLVVSFTVLFATCAFFVKTIKFEKKRSEDLLLNILPADVAEELKKFGKVEPVSHEKATVLFTDFKGFTEISESITAKELVEEINHCFGAFDEIATRYFIEKIKTIGDSYMAVGGNFSGKECTPWHVVSAGLEMQNYITKRKKERQMEGKFNFDMRVGVHSGPVVSGVVGVNKFQFDIWGDTVNIASRMQSNGEIGEVNITETTRNLVLDKFDFDFRGLMPVKGKKDMPMYFVKQKNLV